MFVRAPAARVGLAAAISGTRRPCRTSILSSQPARGAMTAASLDSSADMWKPLEHDEPEDVVFSSLYGLRVIELNRPKKLNALNSSMIRKIGPRLIEWQKSDMANVIVMKGAGNALCAGGDVAVLAEANMQGRQGQKWSAEYFALEYKLDHLIATYQKPYISFMDGVTMGGGVGLSIHAPFRIATERTKFAMPETKIGFFADVGGSFFLPRMPGALGIYLALTSEQLKAADVFYTGIATHYVHSATLPMLESRLAELRFRDFDSMEKRLSLVNDTIEEYCTGLPHDQPILLAGELRSAIDRCFSKSTVGEIIRALEKEPTSRLGEWPSKTIDTLRARSPTSILVTLEQRKQGCEWSIAETFKREYHIAAMFMRHGDFTEGVRALLSDGDNKPKWQPARLEDISEKDEIIKAYFEVSPDVEPLHLLTEADYEEYPWRRYGIPTEAEVKHLATTKNYTPRQIVNAFAALRNGKQGVREIVSEIVARKTEVVSGDIAKWVEEKEEKEGAKEKEEVKQEEAGGNEEVQEVEQALPEPVAKL